MRPIDADVLEKEGWSLHRTIQVDKNTEEYQTKPLKKVPTIEPEPKWIPCSERLPEEDHWLGGSGRQFSENVMVTIVNNSDEDTWVDMTYTIDGEWACELPKYCKIVAWKPLPEPYQEGES